jgi:hypothetical protein
MKKISQTSVDREEIVPVCWKNFTGDKRPEVDDRSLFAATRSVPK